MSLVGSLEDLGLGDILQIISLSQKSGVLLLRSEQGEGRILFRDGLVRAAHLKGGVQTLRALLVDGGVVSAEHYDTAAKRAEAEGARVEDVLVEDGHVDDGRIDAMRRENVESAVIRMFGWTSGDFSFEVRDDPDGESDLMLPHGVNAQYLAMEGTRLRDEHDVAGVEEEPVFSGDVPEDEGAESERSEVSAPAQAEVLEVQADVAEAAEPVAALLESVPEPEEVTEEAATELEAEAELEPVRAESPPIAATERERAEPRAAERAGPDAAPRRVPLVVVDPDLHALEWLKHCLVGLFPRVHIFQTAEQGLVRVRQYLSRASMPIVLVSPDVVGDRLAGIADARAFVERVKAHAPRIPVLWLAAGSAREAPHRPADGCVVRPADPEFVDPRAAGRLEKAAEDLRAELRDTLERLEAVTAVPQRMSAAVLRQLREVTDALSDASNRGVVLPLVIDFATRSFSRVAMFMLRDGEVIGMAQTGLSRAGGPDDKGLAEVRLDARSVPWFASVVERGKPVRGVPASDGDRRLAELLGDALPAEAYVAPIQTGGEVVALLYGDTLPGNTPIPDTSALEVVLHHAGLALDRAVLERALAEAQAG